MKKCIAYLAVLQYVAKPVGIDSSINDWLGFVNLHQLEKLTNANKNEIWIRLGETANRHFNTLLKQVSFQKLLKCALSLNCCYSTWQISPKKITINKLYAPCAHCNITYESQKQKKLHKPTKQKKLHKILKARGMVK